MRGAEPSPSSPDKHLPVRTSRSHHISGAQALSLCPWSRLESHPSALPRTSVPASSSCMLGTQCSWVLRGQAVAWLVQFVRDFKQEKQSLANSGFCRWSRPGLTLARPLGGLCSAGTARTTRWYPCCRAVVQCPRWWWRRDPFHSPVVRVLSPPPPPAQRACREPLGVEFLSSAFHSGLLLTPWGWNLKGDPAQGFPSLSVPSCWQQMASLCNTGHSGSLQDSGGNATHLCLSSSPVVPGRLRFDGFPQPHIGTHLTAVGG